VSIKVILFLQSNSDQIEQISFVQQPRLQSLALELGWLLYFSKSYVTKIIGLSLSQGGLILSGKVLLDDIVASSKFETTSKGSSNFAQFPEFEINHFKKIEDSLVSSETFLVPFLFCL
jgi:hypothetical protein